MPTARHGGQLPKLAGYQLPSRCDDESSTEQQLAPSSGYGLNRRDAGPTVAEPSSIARQAGAGQGLGRALIQAAALAVHQVTEQPAYLLDRGQHPVEFGELADCQRPPARPGRVQSLLGREQLTDFLEPEASPAGEVDDRDPDKDGIREHALAAPARWSFQQPHALPVAQGGHRVPGALGDLANRKPAGRR